MCCSICQKTVLAGSPPRLGSRTAGSSLPRLGGRETSADLLFEIRPPGTNRRDVRELRSSPAEPSGTCPASGNARPTLRRKYELSVSRTDRKLLPRSRVNCSGVSSGRGVQEAVARPVVIVEKGRQSPDRSCGDCSGRRLRDWDADYASQSLAVSP